MGYALAAGAAVSAIGEMTGSAAAERAAKAKARAANDWQAQVGKDKDSAMGLISSPAAMAAHDQALHAQERQVQRQEQLAQSINPALIEQGKQYMQLLQGQSAPVLNNLKDQRALQRQQLVGQLRDQLGSGAETSTAGIQALNQFDQETANHLSNAQMQYTGMMQQGSLAAPGAMTAAGADNARLTDINNASPDAQKAHLMAQFDGLGAGPAQAVINSAGAGQVGAVLQGQGASAIGNNLMSYGASSMGKKSTGNSDSLGDNVKKPDTSPTYTQYQGYMSERGF